MAYAGFKQREPKNPLDEAIATLTEIANGDSEDAPRARRMLADHYGEQEKKAKARAAIRVVHASVPAGRALTPEQGRLLHESYVRASLPWQQQRALERMDQRAAEDHGAGGDRARVEGTSLVLEHMSREQAACRLRELSATPGVDRRPMPSLSGLDAIINRLSGG